MSENAMIEFIVAVDDDVSAKKIVDEVEAGGGQATAVESGADLLPVAVLLALVIPPGISLLVETINRVVHSWKDEGVFIDASREGPASVKRGKIPYGTVAVLTRDGDKVERTDLPEQKIGDYVAGVLKALAGGDKVSATKADKAASASLV